MQFVYYVAPYSNRAVLYSPSLLQQSMTFNNNDASLFFFDNTLNTKFVYYPYLLFKVVIIL